MKLGITYLFTISRFGYPPSLEGDLEALKLISDMGFHYLEMEGLGAEHARRVFTNKQRFKEAFARYGIHVHNFCVVDPELVSMDDDKRKAAYERYKRTLDIGVEFGAETIHIASYAPPVNYIGARPYQLGEDYAIRDTFRLRVSEGFEWQRVWDVLVESCRFTAEHAARYGRTVLMEPRTGEIVCSVDSMIRLIRDVDMPNFKANFDVGHFSAQRENVVLALHKLKGMFANIHIADNDPKTSEHLCLGHGAVDFSEFFMTLKQMGYEGYLGLDLTDSPRLVENILESARYAVKLCKELDIPLEM